jgi:hypothetical protein
MDMLLISNVRAGLREAVVHGLVGVVTLIRPTG